jgi:hypothetical protein
LQGRLQCQFFAGSNHHFPLLQELQMQGINFKAFDLGGHEIARRVWKDYYAKVSAPALPGINIHSACAQLGSNAPRHA